MADRKCLRCQLTFNQTERIYCLYCDSRLVDVGFDNVLQDAKDSTFVDKFFKGGQSLLEKFFKKEQALSHEQLQYLVGSFFRVRSFSFLYSFNRNQYKIGETFRRLLVQPIDAMFFVKIPWLLINILDSLFIRIVYTGHCEKCNWKCRRFSEAPEHSADECEYNKEYSSVLEAILSGKILRNEKDYLRRAQENKKNGKRSAYDDLCGRQRDFEVFLDIFTIWLSIALLIFLLIRLAMPLFSKIYSL